MAAYEERTPRGLALHELHMVVQKAYPVPSKDGQVTVDGQRETWYRC